MKNIDFESERLIYKRVSAEHVTDAYVNWMNDPEVNMYLETGGNYTLNLLKAYVEEQYKKDIYFWAIHLKNSKKHIGNIKIDPIDLKANSGEYGILMGDKMNWGKGYAKEASLAIINYCFDVIKLNKITLGVVEDNSNAVLLYKKIGFRIDAIIEGTKPYNNKISNSLRMSLHAQN
ncbi:GNAT family N-acetyltransferase [Winogradskyella forsetii]|uniref:GNAT family N-acetyltransferase n=1 Tax=Winogradskyella forsetii TaxID=2686077 RepID=UPI0015C18A1A|nr:GNAT family N-acetyltransferase [Winogradskyella forsetii]